MSEKLRHVLERFRTKQDHINLLIEKDPEFMTLLEDYHDCVEALQRWQQSKEPEAETRVDEYRTLVKELEEEIRAELEPPRVGSKHSN